MGLYVFGGTLERIFLLLPIFWKSLLQVGQRRCEQIFHIFIKQEKVDSRKNAF